MVRQCQLAGIARSTVYTNKTVVVDDYELLLLRLLDEEYTRHPFYGSRKMTVWLRAQGHGVNRKRVQRLMQILGLVAMVPGPNTSKKHPQNKVYPYLLRGLAVVRPNQVWSTDITYIRLAHGFMYLVAIIDWYSRKVLAWKVSNTMDVGFCMDCLTEALNQYGAPEIFNTDQGSQADALLQLTPAGAEALLGDKGYDSDALVHVIQERGMQAVIPPRCNRIAPRDCDWFVYKERHLIECFFGKIKHYRRIFSRFEKLARNYMGFIRFVSALIWLR